VTHSQSTRALINSQTRQLDGLDDLQLTDCEFLNSHLQSAVYWMLSKRGEQLLILVRG